MSVSLSLTPVSTGADMTRLRETRAVAERLEASFLSEMLKHGGLGMQENSFSGGTGESQFASFHREALAREMVRSGGLGLADIFFASMMERSHDT